MIPQKNNYQLSIKMNLVSHNFPTNQYCVERTEKRQIVLHHTASGQGVEGDIAWWQKTSERVATAYIVARDGVIHKLFDDNYWAYHLGLAQKNFSALGLSYKQLDKQSIGIEIDSWGYLEQAADGQFYPAKWNGTRNVANTTAKPVKYFYEYCTNQKWRGHRYYERYTTAQIAAVKELVQYLCNHYNIPKTYNSDMWEVSKNALSGKPGIYAHCSYRADKSDIHPQPEIISTLKSINY